LTSSQLQHKDAVQKNYLTNTKRSQIFMNTQAFTLKNGNVEINVTGNDDNHIITFDVNVTSAEHDKPVIDMDKYESAITHHATIKAALAKINSVTIGEPDLNKDGHVGFKAQTNNPADYATAVETLRGLQLLSNKDIPHASAASEERAGPTLLEVIGVEFEKHPEDAPDVAPSIRQENSQTSLFSQRLVRAEAAAETRKTLKVWKLDENIGGMNASVFPLKKSDLTGKEEDVDNALIAVRITPGVDTLDARTETFRNTNEIEKRLLHRHLVLRTGEVYLGTDPTGHRDTGVIIINAGKYPVESLNLVNQTLEAVQQDQAILRLKLGNRHRGMEHRHRSQAGSAQDASTDPIEYALTHGLKAAISTGLLSSNGSVRELEEWVKQVAAEVRVANVDRGEPKRAGGRG
jgi:hypothetical protein